MGPSSAFSVVVVVFSVALGFCVGAFVAAAGMMRKVVGLELALAAIARLDPLGSAAAHTAVDIAKTALHHSSVRPGRAPR
jgi:hypothetical protein